jgi:hypothetical protein
MHFKKITFTLLLFLFVSKSFSQEKFTISGTITDVKNNETLIGVSIGIPERKTGVNTNEYGFYSISLPKGTYKIITNYTGYKAVEETVNLDKNIVLNIKLTESEVKLETVLELENVVIEKSKKVNLRKPEMSINKLSAAQIKKMPVVLGEVDVLKSILLLPGVTNAGEGASGFNVRGGAADQNLILLDEATVFNSSHVFGFFSVFNPDAIKDLKLYKGGIPARFGGRASSVLDIYQKDGNSKNFQMNGGIGLISSRLLAEGPLVKDKGSFLVGARGSYLHLFLKLSEEQKNNTLYFYDLNTKLSYKLNPNNNLYISGYFGRDVFGLSKSFVNTYGNATFNLRWNHLFSNKLFSNLSLIYSDYYYGLNLDFIGFNWDSGIKNYNIKYDFKHYLTDKVKLNYGLNSTYYDFNPGTLSPSKAGSGINFDQLDKKYAFEPAVYFDVEQEISKKLSLSYGLRYSQFYRLGKSTINLYANDSPVNFNQNAQIYEKAKAIGTKFYDSNKTIQTYNYLEPRFSASYQIDDKQAVKASYNRMVQYLQLVSNTASPTPLDVWTPSDNYIKPQIADQVAVGYFRNFGENKYSLEVESFYKKIQNRMDYIDGADLIANKAIEQVILNGQMRAYGLEMMVRKNEGKLTGWISYTLSKSQQQTPGRNASETGINNGNWYSSTYDKLHNLAVTGSYNLNKKWSFGANFALQSGQPANFPNGQYSYEGIVVPSYGLRNESRLPAYHHLDISATLTSRHNDKRKLKSEWVFSIYNLYNQKNAASISFQQNSDTGNNEAIRTSIFGIVPAVSYNFKF